MKSIDRRDFLKTIGSGIIIAGLPISIAYSKELFKAKASISQLHYDTCYAHWFVGKKLGFYKEEGIEQELFDIAGGGETIRSITIGGMNWGGIGVPGAISASQKGEPIKIIGGDVAVPLINWLVKKDSQIKSIKDLKGKKIGYSKPYSNTHFLLVKSLKEENIAIEDVKLLSAGGLAEAITALKTGMVDCTYGAPLIAGKFEKDVRVLWQTSDYFPIYYTTVIGTNDTMIKEHSDILKGFLRAHQKSIDWVENNRDEAVKIWAEGAEFKDVDMAIKAMKLYKKGSWNTKLDFKALKQIEDDLIEFKQINKKVEWDKLVINL